MSVETHGPDGQIRPAFPLEYRRDTRPRWKRVLAVLFCWIPRKEQSHAE